MVPAGQGVVRGARASLAVLVVLGLAVSAHTLAGGGAPGSVALVLLGGAVVPVAWWAAARRLTLPVLLAFLAGAQVFVHLGLAAMAPASGGTSVPRHVHELLPAGLGASGGVVTGGPGTTMLLAHTVATVLAALVLARADRALWRAVLRLLPVVPVPGPVPVVVRVAAPGPAVPRSGRTVRPLGGRAPPLLVS